MTDTQLDDSAKKENNEKTTEGNVEELKTKDKPEESLEKESAEAEATVEKQDEASESEEKDPVFLHNAMLKQKNGPKGNYNIAKIYSCVLQLSTLESLINVELE